METFLHKIYPQFNRWIILLIFFSGFTFSTSAQVIYSENFNAGAGGWTTASVSGRPSTWSIAPRGNINGSNNYGTPNSGAMGYENSYIMSPAINVNADAVEIEFDSYNNNEGGFPSYYDVEWIEFSLNNGQTWIPMHCQVDNLHFSSGLKHFKFKSDIPYGSSVRFRFRYDTGDSCCGPDGWYVDNVIVSSSTKSNFTANTTSTDACSGQPTGTITVNASGGNGNYLYSLNGGSFQSQNTFYNVYPGSHTVSVKDASCAIASATAIVNATTITPTTISASESLNLCPGSTVTLNAQLEPGFTYSWHLNGNPISGATSASYQASTGGNYTLVKTSSGGCTASSNTITVFVKQAPTISASNKTTFCTGDSVILTASGNGQFIWNNGQVGSSIVVKQPGNYSVSITDSEGCKLTSSSVSVNVNELPNVTFKDVNCTDGSTGTATVVLPENTATGNSVYYASGGQYNGGNFYSINVETGAATPIFNTGTALPAIALNSKGDLFGSNGGSLYKINKTTGQLTYLSNFNCQTPSMAFDKNDILYIADHCGQVFTIDVQTGQQTFQFHTGFSTSGMQFDPVSGDLYLTNRTSLYKYNSTTGITDLGYIGSYGNISDLVFDPAGKLYGVAGGGNGNAYLSINKVTGQTTFISYTVSSLSGLTGKGASTKILWSNGQTTATATGLVAGQHSVTITNENGCTSTGYLTITACNAPPVAIAKPLTVAVYENCEATVKAEDFDNGSTDAENDSLTFSISPAGPFALGTHEIVFTVTDTKGASNSINTTIIVEDKTAPVTPVLADVTAQCSKTLTPPTTTDNCSGTVTGTTEAPLTYSAQGTYMVTWKFTDAAGNSTTADQKVIIQDTTLPVFTSTQSNVTVALNASGTAALANYTSAVTATDNCTATGSLTITQSPLAGTALLANVPTTVTLKATDAAGNSSTQTFTVTATDQTAPVALAQNVSIQLDANGKATLTPAQVDKGSSDNVGITSLTLDKTTFTCSDLTPSLTDYKEFFTFVSDNTWRQSTVVTPSNEGSAFWNGVTSVPPASSYTIIPTIGSYSVQKIPGTQGILVDGDVRFLRKTINISNATNLRVTLLASVDNDVQLFVNGVEVALEGDLDGANFADQIHSRVVLNENVPNVNGGPGFQPFDRITSIKASSLFHTGENDVVFAVRNTGANDRGEVSFKVIFERAGSGVPVTLTATDAAGNIATAGAFVTVEDKISPVAPVLATVTAECSATLTAPTATDNCSGVVTGTTTDPVSYSAQGTYTVNWKFTDGSGNFSTASQTVIIKDNTAPTITSVQPNVIVALNESGTAALANYTPALAATDNCTPAGSIIRTQSPVAGTALVPNVLTTVTLKATDAVGNSSVQSFTVIATDQTAPIVKTKNITIALDDTGNAVITPSQVDNGTTDNSGSFTLNLDKTTFDCSNLGANPVNLTAIDASGNSSASIMPSALIGLWDFEDSGKLKDQTGNWGDLILSGTASISGGALDANSGMARTSSYTGATIRSKTLISYVSLDKLNQGAGSAMTIDRVNSDSFDGIIYAEAQTNRWMNGSSNGLRNQNLVPGFAETVPNQLVQVALTYEEKPGNQVLISFYRNGSPYGSYTANNFTTWSANDAEIIFGARHYYNATNQQIGTLDAHISKAMLFNRALTLAEIQSLNGPTTNAVVTIVDQTPPSITSKPISVTLTAAGTVSITPQDVLESGTDNCNGAITYTISKSTFNGQDAISSPVTIQLTGKDGSGNTTTVPVLVTVIDPVPVVLTKNITVLLDANGQAIVAPEQVDNGSSSVVGLSSLTLDKTSFTCENVGVNTVTLTATSTLGSKASATATITVIDKVAPVALAQNVTVQLNASGGASTTAEAVNYGSSDACGIALIVLSKTDFTCENIGANEVVLTVTDNHGNVSTANAIVTVEDKVAPVAIAQNVTVQLNASGVGSTTAAAVNNGSSDACGIASIVLSKTDFNCSNVGVNEVVLTVTDNHGNVSTANAIVTVEDKVAPVAIAQNVTVQLNASGVGSTTAAAVNNGSSDACGIASIVLSKTDFNCSNVGVNEVVLTVTDNHGNVSTANAIVTVEDRVAPVAIAQNVTVQLNASGVGSTTAAAVNYGSSDACGIASVVLSKTDFDCSNVGANEVVLTVTDNHGNVSTANAIVTVEDKVAPVAIAQNVTVQLNASGVGSTTAAAVNNGSSDACGIASITLSKTDFDCSNVGANEVVLTVTDNHGNVSTANATVTVEDNVAPVAVAQNVTVQLNASGVGSTTAAAVNNGSSDACGIASITLSKTDFNCSNVGANEVVLKVTDNHGNVSTANAIVTVEDNVAPVALAQNVTVQLNSSGVGSTTATAVNYGSSDACGIASIVLSKTDFDCSNVGANEVVLTVTDKNGNVSTANAVVTVEDKVAPVVLTKNITIPLDANGAASITDQSVNNGSSDNCGIQSVVVSKKSFDCSNVGANTVTLTVTDIHGNVSSANATVTVEDKVAPVVLTKNITIQLDANGAASITDQSVNNGSSDNCGIQSVVVSKKSFDCSNVGANTVTLTVTDIHGNVSTATATVTVEDKVAPIAIAKNLTINLVGGVANITPEMLNNGSSDACGIKSLALSRTGFDCSSIGNHTVTLTVTDKNNNVSTTTAVVTIVGEISGSSIASLPTSSTYTGGNANNLYLGYGAQSTTLKVTPSVISGNGTVRSYTYVWSGSAVGSLSSTTSATPVFTPTVAGNYNFTVTVTNAYGCKTSSSIAICVKDIREVDKKGAYTGKVFVCHVPNGDMSKANTLSISPSAVAAHLGNHDGDKLGTCDQQCGTAANTIATTNDVAEVRLENSIQIAQSSLTAYPNPFAMQTTVEFKVAQDQQKVSVEVYDLKGVKVKTIYSGPAKAGSVNTASFDGSYLAPGVYFFRLITPTEVLNFKAIKTE